MECEYMSVSVNMCSVRPIIGYNKRYRYRYDFNYIGIGIGIGLKLNFLISIGICLI